MIPFEREVNETLWYAIMKDYDGFTYGVDGDVYEYSNDVFEVRPYDWSEPGDNSWHFWHKPSGFKLAWYKYPLRSPEANFEITHEQFIAILYDCMNSVHPRFTHEINKWWEKYLISNFEYDSPNTAIVASFRNNHIKGRDQWEIFKKLKECFPGRNVIGIPDGVELECVSEEDLKKLRLKIDDILSKTGLNSR